MKTLKEWRERQINLLEYLEDSPCEIDEELYQDQLGAVPPAYLKNGLLQVGEAYTHDENNIMYYFTFKRTVYKIVPKTFNVLYKYHFIGILPEFKS